MQSSESNKVIQREIILKRAREHVEDKRTGRIGFIR